MNYLVAVLISAVFLARSCQGDHPEAKCIRDFKDKNPACIIHCKYNFYKFTDDKYNINDEHMRKLSDILIKYKAVDAAKKTQVDQHLKKCKEEAMKKSKTPSCERIMYYYSCLVDLRLIDYYKYNDAMKTYDNSIYLSRYSN
uniref:14.6 kDa salivary PpSP15-like protein n=1 Tax=Phlebotomus tobbi TaxID=33402 RepID=F6JYE8_9DIPT